MKTFSRGTSAEGEGCELLPGEACSAPDRRLGKVAAHRGLEKYFLLKERRQSLLSPDVVPTYEEVLHPGPREWDKFMPRAASADPEAGTVWGSPQVAATLDVADLLYMGPLGLLRRLHSVPEKKLARQEWKEYFQTMAACQNFLFTAEALGLLEAAEAWEEEESRGHTVEKLSPVVFPESRGNIDAEEVRLAFLFSSWQKSHRARVYAAQRKWSASPVVAPTTGLL